jgi:hypothetical protein
MIACDFRWMLVWINDPKPLLSPHETWHSSVFTNISAWVCSTMIWSYEVHTYITQWFTSSSKCTPTTLNPKHKSPRPCPKWPCRDRTWNLSHWACRNPNWNQFQIYGVRLNVAKHETQTWHAYIQPESINLTSNQTAHPKANIPRIQSGHADTEHEI